MGSKKSLISIVIPIYNAEQYLEECLQSVLCQTYSNIEVICVNDGSTDNSLEILKKHKQEDNRIVIVDKQNTGVSEARNTGLSYATGKYVMFVDSDDWIELNTCEEIFKNNMSDADVLFWGYISEGSSVSRKKSLFDGDQFFTQTEVKEKLHRRFIGLVGDELRHPELADSLSTVWGKAYRRSIIINNDIRFIDLKEIGSAEDGMFNLSFFEYCNSAVYIDRHLYHYRRQTRKSVTSGYRSCLYEQWTRLFLYMENYINEKHLSEVYIDALNNRIALSTVGLTLNVVRSNYSLIEKKRLIGAYLREERFIRAYKRLDMSYFKSYWRVFYTLCKFSCSLGVLLLGMAIQELITH